MAAVCSSDGGTEPKESGAESGGGRAGPRRVGAALKGGGAAPKGDGVVPKGGRAAPSDGGGGAGPREDRAWLIKAGGWDSIMASL